MSGWLCVAPAEHVRRGVALGIAQIGHGKRAGLARMRPGGTLVYYSPVECLGDRTPLRYFTAIGTIAGDIIWQADKGGFWPFRRLVRYEDTRPISLDDVKTTVTLTSTPSWGDQLRRGLIALRPGDVDVLRKAMHHPATQ